MTAADSDQALLEEAAAWLQRLRAATGARHRGAEAEAAATRAALRAWLAADPRHAAALDLVTRAWSVGGGIDTQGALAPDIARARRLRLAAGRPTNGETADGRSIGMTSFGMAISHGGTGTRTRPAWRPAAGLAGMAALALILWNGAVSDADYTAPAGQRPLVRLADGTLMRLDGGTHAHVRIDPLGRHVTLADGRAEFRVAHEGWRAFQVETPGLDIRDLGTRFTVEVRPGQVRAALLEGAVEVLDPTNGHPLARLVPGQEVRRDGAAAPVVAPTTAAQALAWEEGRMVFDDQPLAAVLRQVAQRCGVGVQLDDPSLGDLRVSGSYREDDIPAFLTALTRLHPIVWRRDDKGEYRIARRP